MTDHTHDDKSLKDIQASHRRWLAGSGSGERADLIGANMSKANMSQADMSGANMSQANMSQANMRWANMSQANMSWANMSQANMSWANMSGADMSKANMSGADMSGANMSKANMSGADLEGCIGNMREIKSAQFDTWPITWTRNKAGITTLQIGCQRHDLELWRKSDPRWIAAMDDDASEWWGKYRDIILALVDASPATPHAG